VAAAVDQSIHAPVRITTSFKMVQSHFIQPLMWMVPQ